jgi:hypothetical protein
MGRLSGLKKFTLLGSIFCLLAIPVASSAPVAAVDVLPFCKTTTNADKTVVCKAKAAPTSGNPVIGVIRSAIQIFTVILGVAAVIVVIISGLKYITAGGDTSAVESARKTLTYALVGLAVAALAQAIVSLVLSKL